MKKKLLSKFLIISLLLFNSFITAVPMYFCTAANERYYTRLINLIGSIHSTNYEQTEEIAVFDLGLSAEQIKFLNQINKVNVYKIELTHPDLLKPVVINKSGTKVPGWYAWKPVIIKQSLDMFPYVLWVDAATTILRPLDDLFFHIKNEGYFFCTIGDDTKNNQPLHPISWGTTSFVKTQFNLNTPENKWILSKEYVMAGIIGASKKIKDSLINEMYQLTKDLRNFADDGTTPNGFGTGRYEQTILSILTYSKNYIIHQQDRYQELPILLNSKNPKTAPFFITWDVNCVSNKTHIYSSRTDLSKFKFFTKNIQYKTLEKEKN